MTLAKAMMVVVHRSGSRLEIHKTFSKSDVSVALPRARCVDFIGVTRILDV